MLATKLELGTVWPVFGIAMFRFLLRDGNIINAPVELDDDEVLSYEDGDGHTTHALLTDEAEARLMALLSITHLNAA